jgi:hypothetical protein
LGLRLAGVLKGRRAVPRGERGGKQSKRDQRSENLRRGPSSYMDCPRVHSLF